MIVVWSQEQVATIPKKRTNKTKVKCREILSTQGGAPTGVNIANYKLTIFPIRTELQMSHQRSMFRQNLCRRQRLQSRYNHRQSRRLLLLLLMMMTLSKGFE